MHKPDWLAVRAARPDDDENLRRLDRGEREAIVLAGQLDANLILLDERAARRIASVRGLRVAGTLGILNVAAQRGLLDVGQAVERLKQTSFRAAPGLYEWLLQRHPT